MKIIAECWDKQQTLSKKSIVSEQHQQVDPVVGLANAAIVYGTGGYGVYLRNKRQQILFDKVMKRFPTAKDMCKFLNSRGYDTKNLTPDTDRYEYVDWVRKNITKEGRFWRIVGQVLGFGLPAGIYNIGKYHLEKDRNAEDSVDAYMR